MAIKRTRSSPKGTDSLQKRPREDARNLSRQCSLVECSIWSVDEHYLSGSMREILSKLVSSCLGVHKDLRHSFQAAAVVQIQEVLDGIRSRLDNVVADAQAKIDGADADRMARANAASAAMAAVAGLEAAVVDGGKAATQARVDLEAAKKACKKAEVVQQEGDMKINAVIQRKSDVEAVVVGNLSASKTRGLTTSEKTSVMDVCNMCKLDQSLLNVLPEVLQKAPDDRRRFDTVALTQIEDLLVKQVAELVKTIEEDKPAMSERAALMEDATKAAEDAKSNRDLCNKALAEAKKALASGLDTVKHTEAAVKRFLADLKENADAFDSAKRELNNFVDGAYSTFTTLRDMESPQSPAEPTQEHVERATLDAKLPLQAAASATEPVL